MSSVSLSKSHLDVGDPPPVLTTEEERRLWRKIDLRLLPILAVMYLLSFMDRGAVTEHSFSIDMV